MSQVSHYQSERFHGREFNVAVALRPPPIIGFATDGDNPKPLPLNARIAVYRLANEENGEAVFVGWEDDLIAALANSPMVRALGNASDDDILKLMNDIAEADKGARQP